MGEPGGKSEEQERATMESLSTQDIWGEQTPYLTQLYGQGQALSQDPAYAQQAQQMGAQVTDPLMGGYQQAFGPESAYGRAAAGVTDPLISGLSQMVSEPSYAPGGSPLLGQNVAMALEQASQNFQRNIAPGIEREAIAQGQFGGTRGDLALGTAASEANRQALQAAMGAYGEQYQSDIGAQAQREQNRLAAAQQMQDILGGQVAGIGQGVQAGGGLFNLGMGAQAAQWDPLMQQAGLLGQPLVLGETAATGVSVAERSPESPFAPWQSFN